VFKVPGRISGELVGSIQTWGGGGENGVIKGEIPGGSKQIWVDFIDARGHERRYGPGEAGHPGKRFCVWGGRERERSGDSCKCNLKQERRRGGG